MVAASSPTTAVGGLAVRDQALEDVTRPAPTTTPHSYRTAAWPAATPYAGSSSSTRKPRATGFTDASTAGERYRNFTSARSTSTKSLPSARTERRASDSRGPTTTRFVAGTVFRA